MKENIEKRIAELKQEIERFTAEANRQLGALQGAIAENERMLAQLANEEKIAK